jgi:hypothetical protein
MCSYTACEFSLDWTGQIIDEATEQKIMYARRALDLNLRSLMVLPRRTIEVVLHADSAQWAAAEARYAMW